MIFYLRGLGQLSPRGNAPGRWRVTGFLVGLGLMYGSLQTRFDYYAQHMFFLHRLQHLALHHLGPFLVALSAPQRAIMAGMPQAMRRGVTSRILGNRVVRGIYRVIQQPAVSALIFVGLIYLWLYPGVHFYAMLNVPLYNLMNWSMAIDGLLFWWMIFNLPRQDTSPTAYFGGRILALFLIMPPQIVAGAYLSLSHHSIYSVYAVCGRLWPISPLVDQELGGLNTWIPACMMSVLAGVIVLSRWMQRDKPVAVPLSGQEKSA